VFLKVYGCWLGGGSLRAPNRCCFGLRETDWLREALRLVGLSASEWSVEAGRVCVSAGRWVEFFASQECEGMAMWAAQQSVTGLRQMIDGLLLAAGDGGNCVVVRSERLRDDVVNVLMLAGFSAMFETLDGGESFRVLFADPRDWSEPVTSHTAGEIGALSVASRVWCLTMPSGLLWVRRTQRDGAGRVERAWRPVLTGNCGSPGYVAPEVIRGEDYDLSVDMFSLGAIVYVLLAGYPPFWGEEMETIISKNLNVDFTFAPMYWAQISEPPKKLIRGLVVKDPAARLTAQQVLQSDFLKDVKL
jgi:serine/threonine protein kinase